MDYSPPREDSLDDLIGAIYDCVIDPSRWTQTVDRIRRRYGFHNTVLGVNGPVTNEVVLDIVAGVPEAMIPIMKAANSEDIIKMWGGWARIAAAPLEEPIRQSDVRPPDWAKCAYYEDFVKPQAIVDSVAIVLVRDLQTVATIAFGMQADVAPVADPVMDELRILAPHMRRAIVIGRLIETAMSAASTFADVLDAAAAGVVLVDGARRVVHANSVATAMLAAGDPIHAATGVLELSSELVPGSLQRAIETAAEATAGSKGTGVPARRLNGQPLTVQVMPLERRIGLSTLEPAIAAVFISEAASGPATSAEILAVLFDLTPAEARVFGMVAQGRELSEIADELGIALATVKTHLARIYHKTGQSNRSGLVRLAQDIAPPA